MSSGYARMGANVPRQVLTVAAMKKPLMPEATIIASSTPTDVLNPKQMGYTGNTCSFCSSTRMTIAGHCEVCADCGTSSGCS